MYGRLEVGLLCIYHDPDILLAGILHSHSKDIEVKLQRSDGQTLPGGEYKLFPAREILVSDIPAGGRKIANLFYIVEKYLRCSN